MQSKGIILEDTFKIIDPWIKRDFEKNNVN